MHLKYVFTLMLCLVLSACATKQVSVAEAIPVASERVYGEPPKGDTYTVKVVRDKGYAGSACMARIFIDGKDAADLKPGEVVALTLSTGRHIIGASPSPASGIMCSAFDAAARHRREVEVSGITGETRIFRFAISVSGDISLAPTAF